MNAAGRPAARITYTTGEITYATYSPDIPPHTDDAELLAKVVSLCLQGDVANIEPVEIPADISAAPDH